MFKVNQLVKIHPNAERAKRYYIGSQYATMFSEKFFTGSRRIAQIDPDGWIQLDTPNNEFLYYHPDTLLPAKSPSTTRRHYAI
jgi:hypothetical protein